MVPAAGSLGSSDRPPAVNPIRRQHGSRKTKNHAAEPERPLLGQDRHCTKHQRQFQAEVADVDPGDVLVNFVAFGLVF